MEKKILDITSNYYKYLLSLKNVIGIGMGYKYINGVKTKELCMHVLVDKKVDERFISKNNIIPKTYMGIKTDVIKSGKVNLLNETIKDDELDREFKIRPLEGGYTIRTDNTLLGGSSVGTIGCIVTKTFGNQKFFFILSNNHVLTAFQRLPIGTSIFQPIKDEYLQNYIGDLSTYVNVKYNYKGDNLRLLENIVDCAIVIVDPRLVSNRIAIIGRINGTVKPNLGLYVRKVGRTSGYTEGEIITVGETINIPVDEQKKMFFKNLMTGSLKSESGDSGSVIVDENNNIVGLLIAGEENGNCIFCDINTVLEKLDVEIYTG